MKRILSPLLAGIVPLTGIAIPSFAHAEELESCGHIFLTGESVCEFRRDRDCHETCEVVSVEESCAASLYTTCESECTAEASAECTEARS